MRRIVLASRSQARQELLKQIGLKFSCDISRAAEKNVIMTSRPALVMDNALAKALDVAGRYKSGIIIGADTLAFVGRQVIGKPRNIDDAHRTLKILSRYPQWIYSGVAVVDARSGKRYVDFEKTKVYMRPLKAAEIRGYFRKVSPLDKAGSFDIQGLGGAFINRLEGCFYNVVGLPLSKLVTILGKFGIDILR